ncbi:MAG: hypothetical protein HYW79_00615 [Parcubacteria group bacterium]|nr:hypothetical protein [Parcubacteria group bacterium]
MSSQNKKAHFIGICGAGMSAVAKLLIDYGWQVSGSDDNFYPPVSEYIKRHNINFKKGYSPSNIPKDTSLIIIGRHSGLTKEENKEVEAAFSSGVSVKSFPEVLGELNIGKENVVAVGSYGKSTCAALVAWCLEYAGKDPSYFIGAIPNTPDESSKKGDGNIFVLEGDEYPTSNWDDSSKFLHYHPKHVLLTSLAHDHVNVFKTHNDYKAPFIELLSSIPPGGLIVACADGEGVKETISKCGLEEQTNFYSTKSNADWHIENIKLGEITCFDIFKGESFIVNVKTNLLGLHNVENILGAGVLLLSLNLVVPSEFSEAIASFKAINRRLDKKSDKTSVPFYEGFGSSLPKAKSAIEAVRAHFPGKKLIILFEPHSLSWRSREAIDWYDRVFDGAYQIFIYKPPNDSGLTLKEIVNRVSEAGHSVRGFDSIQKGIVLMENNVDKDSVVLAMSSGGFDGFVGLVTKWLEENYKK